MMDKDGKFVSNTCIVNLVPVHIDLYFTNSDSITTFNIVSTNAYIKYAYIYLLKDSTETHARITLLNGCNLNEREVKQIKVRNISQLNNFSISFIGSDTKIPKPPTSIFLSKLSIDNPIVSINTKNKRPTIIKVDDTYFVDTPAKINLSKGIHSIQFLYNEKTLNYTFNLLTEESLIFNLDSSDSTPPTIYLYNNTIVSADTKQIKIKGKVNDQSTIDSLSINDTIVSLKNNSEFEKEVKLKNIVNTIVVAAVDKFGNASTVFYSITKEVDVPQIFTSTVPNITTKQFLKLDITTKNVYMLYINGIPCMTSVKCTKFIKLKPGKNFITLSGKNKFGLSTEKKLTVVYSPLPKTQLLLKIGSKNLYVNGVRKLMDVPPIIMWNRTLLPIRHIIEALHGSIEWNPEHRTVNIQISGAEISLKIGSNIATVNGKEVQIDKNPSVMAIIKNNRTYIPLRFVIEQIGGKVTWFPKTKEIEIIFPNY